jgi:hypothetical protein
VIAVCFSHVYAEKTRDCRLGGCLAVLSARFPCSGKRCSLDHISGYIALTNMILFLACHKSFSLSINMGFMCVSALVIL